MWGGQVLRNSSYQINLTIDSIDAQILVEQFSDKIWHNRGFNDKSVKTSKNVDLDLLNKIGYGPLAQLFNMAAISKMAPKNNTNF